MGRRPAGDDRAPDDALKLCRSAATAADMRTALSVALPGRAGTSLAETAEIIGVSLPTVSRLRRKFLSGKRPQPGWKAAWGGRRRGNLSEKEELRFMEKWIAAVKKGNLRTLDAVYRDCLRAAGTASPKATLHRLVKKYGWKKVRSENGFKAWACPK